MFSMYAALCTPSIVAIFANTAVLLDWQAEIDSLLEAVLIPDTFEIPVNVIILQVQVILSPILIIICV